MPVNHRCGRNQAGGSQDQADGQVPGNFETKNTTMLVLPGRDETILRAAGNIEKLDPPADAKRRDILLVAPFENHHLQAVPSVQNASSSGTGFSP